MSNKTLELKTDEDIKMVFDPFRRKIVEIYIKSNESMTAKQVADKLGEAPAKVNYHIKKLVNYGTLILERTENINGIIAKFYKSVYDSILFKGTELSKDVYLSQSSYIEKAYKELSTRFQHDLKQHLDLVANSSTSEQRRIKAQLQHLYMTPEEQNQFIEDFYKMIEPYLVEDEGKEVFSMLHTMARIK